MKAGRVSWFLISLLIVVALSTALLYTNVWYLVLLAGLVASIVVRKGYLISITSAFLGGVFGILIILLSLPFAYISPLMSEVGAIAGISSTVLVALMFVINGALNLAGSLIGTFVSNIFRKTQ